MSQYMSLRVPEFVDGDTLIFDMDDPGWTEDGLYVVRFDASGGWPEFWKYIGPTKTRTAKGKPRKVIVAGDLPMRFHLGKDGGGYTPYRVSWSGRDM